jgi:hypothetical protein
VKAALRGRASGAAANPQAVLNYAGSKPAGTIHTYRNQHTSPFRARFSISKQCFFMGFRVPHSGVFARLLMKRREYKLGISNEALEKKLRYYKIKKLAVSA